VCFNRVMKDVSETRGSVPARYVAAVGSHSPIIFIFRSLRSGEIWQLVRFARYTCPGSKLFHTENWRRKYNESRPQRALARRGRLASLPSRWPFPAI